MQLSRHILILTNEAPEGMDMLYLVGRCSRNVGWSGLHTDVFYYLEKNILTWGFCGRITIIPCTFGMVFRYQWIITAVFYADILLFLIYLEKGEK